MRIKHPATIKPKERIHRPKKNTCPLTYPILPIRTIMLNLASPIPYNSETTSLNKLRTNVLSPHHATITY